MLCSDSLNVRWDLYYKFAAESHSERILKMVSISQSYGRQYNDTFF